MNNFLRINYNLNLHNVENILEQNVNFNNSGFVLFQKKNYIDKTPKFKKPTKENILMLKEKLESFERIFKVEFKDFCIYKKLIFLCENLKPRVLYFNNCSFEKGTEKEVLNLINNCNYVSVHNKIDKILLNVIKDNFKLKDKSLLLSKIEYKSIKNIFFGMYLNILNLKNLETNEREMRKILKSLHGTVSLQQFSYENKEAYGLIYNRKKIIKSNNKKLNENIVENKKELVKNSVELTFKVKKVNEIFLSLLPNWINEVEIMSNYNEEDFKYLLTKFYKGGILNKIEYINVEYFGNLTKQTEIDLLEYVTNLK